MAPRLACEHEKARFLSFQRLGKLPPVGLWHCPECGSTVSDGRARRKRSPVAAA